MELRWKIFLGFGSLILAALLWGLHLSREELRPRYLEAIEDTLFDMSSYLSNQIEDRAVRPGGRIDVEALKILLEKPGKPLVPAQIYSKTKSVVELRIYVTDAKGRLLFDSSGPEEIGRDYSKWNDVLLTLHGKYGARSTRADATDPLSSTLYVAAPLRQQGRIVGVVSVGKPLESLRGFFKEAENKFLQGVALLIGLSLAITFFISNATLSSLRKLSAFVRSLGSGNPKPFPKLSSPEIRQLGESFLEMKTQLEGREYVERYVTSLTHEIKSPLSALLGATELLDSKEISDTDRARLLRNVRDESLRLKEVSEQILELASLEKRSRPLKMETFDLNAVVEEIQESLTSQLIRRRISIELTTSSSETPVRGERFLIWRALYNIVQNAVEFSPENGRIRIQIENSSQSARVIVTDEGPGLPDFVKAKLFEKFFSTERPSTGKRGIGLGLSFAQEVVSQHGGHLELTARSMTEGDGQAGTSARVELKTA